ncbi:hypothetical protein DVS28_a4465 [Euzebya pacifica]|uniref:Uncharacterized protein n=1 Tax=Euzebya pacifica TaxID=1608957 RepID=A0A346Y3T3_9ACTN|nr:hypothetical protein DVS28_a4465 [Euzebya pacifica]
MRSSLSGPWPVGTRRRGRCGRRIRPGHRRRGRRVRYRPRQAGQVARGGPACAMPAPTGCPSHPTAEGVRVAGPMVRCNAHGRERPRSFRPSGATPFRPLGVPAGRLVGTIATPHEETDA